MNPVARLKTTTSRCPTCRTHVPAEVLRLGDGHGRVILRRLCPTHGESSICLASDARFYWLSRGASQSENDDGACGCGPAACRSSDGSIAGTLGRNARLPPRPNFEQLSTCLCLIEVVHSCNLSCPTCFSASPLGTGSRVDAPPLADLQARIQGVIERKGRIEILQLSGGEPTLHPRFHELFAWCMDHPGIDYVLLNTNGVLLAHDPAFTARLASIAKPGKFQLYLQFDGPDLTGQHPLRGADLRATRSACLHACAQNGLAVTLAMTVTPANLPQVWPSIEFGLGLPHVRGISFQPRFLSGRVPPEARISQPSLNTADILLAAVNQSAGRLRFEDFTPLPCGDPNCATIGYLLRIDGQIRSISDFVDFTQVQGFLHDRVRYRPEDLARCGCDSEPLGELLRKFELDERHTFRLFVKPFMDDRTWDQDRIDRCCTHVIRPDGQLDSFCRYYSDRA